MYQLETWAQFILGVELTYELRIRYLLYVRWNKRIKLQVSRNDSIKKIVILPSLANYFEKFFYSEMYNYRGQVLKSRSKTVLT